MSTNSINREHMEIRAGHIVKIQVKKADLYFKLVPVGHTVLSGGSTAGQEAYLGNPTTLDSTGWKKIQDGDSDDVLVPVEEDIFYQFFYGISKSTSRVYKQFVSGRDKGALNKSMTIGGNVGYFDGLMSPYHDPSHRTETWMLKGYDLAFNGYNTSSITSKIKMQFLINKYRVVSAIDDVIEQPLLKNLARTIPLGGDDLVSSVQWMNNLISESKKRGI